MTCLYSYRGEVIKGLRRGKKTGYPTANMLLDKKIPEGTYISVVTLKEKRYKASTFIGRARTFENMKYQSETYILDFDENIYGETMTVELIEKIRENKKFPSVSELVEQIKKDVDQTEKFFSSRGEYL